MRETRRAPIDSVATVPRACGRHRSRDDRLRAECAAIGIGVAASRTRGVRRKGLCHGAFCVSRSATVLPPRTFAGPGRLALSGANVL